jgi:hypothetical protein
MGARSASWTRSTSTSSEPSPLPNVGDPVGTGIVASLARPGGNVTGLSLLDAELDGKRIELLKEAVPYLRRLAVLWSANDPGMTLAFGRVEMAAKALGFSPRTWRCANPGSFHAPSRRPAPGARRPSSSRPSRSPTVTGPRSWSSWRNIDSPRYTAAPRPTWIRSSRARSPATCPSRRMAAHPPGPLRSPHPPRGGKVGHHRVGPL